MLKKPFRVKGPESLVSRMTFGTTQEEMDAHRGTIKLQFIKELKPSPERILMTVETGKRIVESGSLIQAEDGPFFKKSVALEGSEGIKEFPLELAEGYSLVSGMASVDKGVNIFVGRMGDLLGNDEVVLVDGREIVDGILETVEDYRARLDLMISSAGDLLLGPEIQDTSMKKRHYDENKEAQRALIEVAGEAMRIQWIKMLAMGICEHGEHSRTEELDGFRPPALALMFPERFRTISAASGIMELVDLRCGEGSEVDIVAYSFHPWKNMSAVQADEFFKSEVIALGDEALVSFSGSD